MKEPVGRYSPEGADFETCEACTHQALVTILLSQALDRHTVCVPACSSVVGGMGAGDP
eukprot:CAMPEP_0206053994 /NCGR_PEP_ID=MMETSP1466-20131121/37022_1 /ASSEMBLY_ACC=CAM_ASM_001126 /TAXON_ID=44452 /ORGANISM="Pavlova gyrans, Strain CCMP608" /LENGTH=57 /DNA_ID=CAMNT_0053429187 /DNA_START=31 /DNA_END=200 /DNA_ORIENTATION=+